MKFCDYCQDDTAAVYLMTVKDSHGRTIATLDDLPVCEDHLEEVDASVQMVNLTKTTGFFTITHKRIEE